MKTKTIVLIHGMFMNPLCWENRIPRYQAKGYRVLAPAWPGRDKSVDELRMTTTLSLSRGACRCSPLPSQGGIIF